MSINKKLVVLLVSVLIVAATNLPILAQFNATQLEGHVKRSSALAASLAASSSSIPLRRAIFVAADSESYLDEFAYMAAVPMSIFYDSGTKYVSPLLYSDGKAKQDNLLEDWVEYLQPDGGISQAISVGDMSASRITQLQRQTGTRVYPQIIGQTSHEIAAKLAANDWNESDIAVIALAKDHFEIPLVQAESSSYVFENMQLETERIERAVPIDSPLLVNFEPPEGAGWIYGVFNWTTSDPLVHQLRDPAGRIVDYSVYRQAFFKRNSAYVSNLVPTHFWLPKNMDGTWEVKIEPGGTLMNSLPIDMTITYYPSFQQTISVPANANWLNITADWSNAGTIVNMALIDPNGRMVQWEPSESLLSGAGGKSMEMPYPVQGDWNLICAWMNPTDETNALGVDWAISTLPTGIGGYLESASNGATLASLLNVPLLYANSDSLPAITEWALSRLGVTNTILVDPAGLQSGSLSNDITALVNLTNLNTYPAVSQMISSLSNCNDVILTLPFANNNELFPAASLSGAFHGAPIFSLGGDDNSMTTRAEETWAPYLIGPNIDIFVTRGFEKRIENGWYDERIPNIYSMYNSADSFEDFLTQRGAYNDSANQNILILSRTETIKPSFDRSLQSHFIPGRIPAGTPQSAAFMINKATLHSFIFRIAESADTSLLTMYAYTDGDTYLDNFGNAVQIRQYDDIEAELSSVGFSIESHIGVNEVFNSLNSQVSLWSFSTHGTLSQYPDDPPPRPNGLGVFSLRDEDAPYGFEVSLSETTVDDNLVNPVVHSSENAHHITRTTDDLAASVDYLGSPIVTTTACLLGGTKLPRVLMERGAVAVIAAPRTVYFQPAGLLTVYFTQALANGNSTGTALNYALRSVSYDYTNIQSYTPRDYANQQILFGDPSILLLNPNTVDRVQSVDPNNTFGAHTPNQGVPSIAAIGATSYLPSILDDLGVEHEFYIESNLSESLHLFSLFKTVMIEPDILDTIDSFFSSRIDLLRSFVRRGGTLVVLGVDGEYSWMPTLVSYSVDSSGSEIEIDDAGHPLMSIPNDIEGDIHYTGVFTQHSSNLSILATAGMHPVILAGQHGLGKLALTTIDEQGPSRIQIIENAVTWNSQPSIVIGSILKNQEIIWSGDRVTIEIELVDREGNPIEGAEVHTWINSSPVAVTESGNGYYSIILNENWTSSRTGIYDIRIHAALNGMDTLDATILDFIFIRPFPWPVILGLAGVMVAVAVIWVYRKRRKGEPILEYKEYQDSDRWKELTRKERERLKKEEEEKERRQKEEDEKFNPKEFFGV
ncbi:hypothetical protein EU537_04665 [Candidatus Thorarchaeota archaeon]|nr:MAG: hypothetical protein EU537_04665 [Candidatus Thorarchaeota archaeon]